MADQGTDYAIRPTAIVGDGVAGIAANDFNRWYEANMVFEHWLEMVEHLATLPGWQPMLDCIMDSNC